MPRYVIRVLQVCSLLSTLLAIFQIYKLSCGSFLREHFYTKTMTTMEKGEESKR